MNHSAGSNHNLNLPDTEGASPFSLYGLTDQWFTHSPFGAVLMNLECCFLTINAAFCSMLGYEEAQLKQLNMPAIVHPDELLRCMHQSSQLAAGAISSFQGEQRFIHHSGESVWCSVHTSLLRDEQGEPRYLLLQTQNINDKKKLEAALNSSILTFSSLLESVPFALAILNHDWKISYVNKAAEDIFMLRREALTGKNIWRLFPKAAVGPVYKELHRAMEEKVYTYIHQYYSFQQRWYEISCQPAKDGICVFFRETTALKKQESAYLESKLQIASMIDHAPDAISILDLQYRILKVNTAYTELFGFTENELIGKRPPIIPEELNIETHTLFQQAARGRQIVGFETKRLGKNNRMLDVSLTIFPLKNAENIIVALFVTIRDISGSRQMELQLRQSEENYKIITENTHDLISILTSDGHVTYASPSHQQVLDINPDTLIGVRPFDYLKEPWKTQAMHFFTGMVKNKEPRKLEICCTGQSPDQVKTLEMHGVPVTGQDGSVDTIVIVSRDISERKNTEELLRRSDKLSVAGQLAAGIAHEIRNPLTALKGFTQFMYGGGPHKDQYLSIMMSELTRIEEIISELLMLAKPQSVTYKNRQIEPILRDVISLLRSQANLSGAQMMLCIHTPLPEVHCEENQLKQVFINLLKNGIEAMPDGGIIRISVQETADGLLSISFQDQGGGIPSEKLSRLGEPFFTTKEKGSGLGLMISQKILNEHGGTLHFSSEPGHGTAAVITLPPASN